MLLSSKINRPSYSSRIIDRARLYRQLDHWRDYRAVVIHAPAGYGKSTLVSRWIDICDLGEQAAWLSLDEADCDARQWVQDVAAALDKCLPGALALVQPALIDQHGSPDRALMRLLTAVETGSLSPTQKSEQGLLLVLDDLQRSAASEVIALINQVLEFGPPLLHLIVLARQPTDLSLARLYAHGKILALDKLDLRFSVAEIQTYLEEQGFGIVDELDAAQLAQRSEGWISGLQLAVLSLRQPGSLTALFQILKGDRGWLAEFLIEEVLERQEPGLRQFLMQTSILARFNTSLCAAVTGMADAYAHLAAVTRADLFLIELNHQEGWFRYHHLFQELLQHQLHAQVNGEFIAELHRRAAGWLSEAGDIPAAVGHYLAADARDQVAELVESYLRFNLLQDPDQARKLLALIPEDLLVERTQLMLDRCRLANIFDDSLALQYALEAEHTLQAQAGSNPNAERQHAEWLVMRAGGSYLNRDSLTASEYLHQAQANTAYLDDFHLGCFHALQMVLHRAAGQQQQGLRSAEASLAAFTRADYVTGTVALQRELAKMHMQYGDRAEANRMFKEIFERWKQIPIAGMRDLVLAYFPAFSNSYWQDHLDQAKIYQQSALDFAEQLNDPDLIQTANYLGLMVGIAARDRNVDALKFLERIRQFATPNLVDLILDCETRLLIASGQSDLAWQLLQAYGLNLQDSLMDHVHNRLIIYLRTRIAYGNDLPELTPFLAEKASFAAQGGFRFRQLQILALTAWQQLKLSGGQTVNDTLAEAVQLARQTGYVRIILDIPELAALLPLVGLSLEEETEKSETGGETIILTPKEQQVLELLAAEYTYPQISDEMVISVNTVRTHVKNLYRKLSVTRRDQAAAVARQLELLR
jgi:LuxR family maltose regulon positive regulatory protein